MIQWRNVKGELQDITSMDTRHIRRIMGMSWLSDSWKSTFQQELEERADHGINMDADRAEVVASAVAHHINKYARFNIIQVFESVLHWVPSITYREVREAIEQSGSVSVVSSGEYCTKGS